MRPSKLVFNGINSFSERTQIDFDNLTANGLFGIFGETGSGKSTILDCINFALYGNVDRSKKKTDIINYNCEQAEVEFEFTLLSEGTRKRYRVERSIKKKSGLGKAMLYVYDGDGSVCIADNTTSVNSAVENILGLNAEDFRKCIALPQGEFAQFVKCVPAERYKIIERLFSLSRYGEGLKEKLAKRENEIEVQYLTAKAELAAYADVNPEAVEESKKKFEADSSALKAFEKQGNEIKSTAERLNAVYRSKTELENARKEFDIQLLRFDAMENLRKLLKSVPQCKRVDEINKELIEKRRECEDERRQELIRRNEIVSLNERFEKLTSEFEKANYEDEISKLKVRLATFDAASSDIAELDEIVKDLDVLRNKYRTAAINCERLRKEEQTALEEAEQAKKQLEACVSEDLGEMLEVKLKPAILRGEYTDQIVYCGDLRESIKGYDDGGELYKFLREELTDRIKYYEAKILALQSEKVNVDEIINKYKEQTALCEKLIKENEEKREKLALCRQNRAVTDNEIDVLKRDGEERKGRFVKLKEKLDALFGKSEEGYAKSAERIKSDCGRLIASRDNAARSIEESKKRLDELKLSAEKSAVKVADLEKGIKSLEERLKKALSDSGYESVEQCASVLRTVQMHGDAESELAAYDEKSVALKSKIAELKAVDGINEVNSEQVEIANGRLREWETAVKEKHAEVRLAEDNFKRLSEKLNKKAANESSFNQIIKRREVVFRLKELTRGNKFLEYVAGEYLSDVSKAASVTLLKLTGGRYFLVYEDGFFVGDNYNEGKKRGVNTLSGGETFLVSLSLALALSSAICRGSLKSIEFFFLDEGFGTLDESLVDTVMDSLEKLRSAEFTIGIISHVEELKHRIESKIIVNKATETHGSTIQS